MGSGRSAETTAGMFNMSCRVDCEIDALPEKVWGLLTDAGDMVRWNSTVSRIEGTISKGQRLAIRVPAAPGRTWPLPDFASIFETYAADLKRESERTQ